MSTATTRSTDPRQMPAPDPVSWHCWPLVDGAPWSLLTCLVPVAVAWSIRAVADSWVMGFLITAALLWSVWRYWVPVHWRCDDQGLYFRVLAWRRRIPWSRFRSFRIRRDGALLFASEDTVPIDALRAIFVPWGKRREEVLRQIEFHLGQYTRHTTSDASASKTQIQPLDSGKEARGKKKPPSTVTGSLNLFFDFFR